MAVPRSGPSFAIRLHSWQRVMRAWPRTKRYSRRRSPQRTHFSPEDCQIGRRAEDGDGPGSGCFFSSTGASIRSDPCRRAALRFELEAGLLRVLVEHLDGLEGVD